jgi:hypothetical protein
MSQPPTHVLETRVRGLELDHLSLLTQLSTIRSAVERNAHTLQELEDALAELALNTTEQAGALAEAMAQRQQHLTEPEPAQPAPPPAEQPPAEQPPAGHPPAEPVPRPDLATVHAWVDRHIAPLVRKTTTTGEGGGIRWCRDWTRHFDAVERLTALYLAYQQFSADSAPAWRSVFLRDHLDPHLATLTSPYGPFHACTPRRHSDTTEPLGHLAAAAPEPGSQP